MNPSRYVIIPAGGTGSRMGLPHPKQLLPFGGRTILEHIIDLFAGLPVYVAVPRDFWAVFREKIGERAHLVPGGATRFASVRNAFEAIPDMEDEDLIAIHDAARPFLDPDTLEDAWRRAEEKGAVIYANRAVDTIKKVGRDGFIQATLDRERIYHAQTPQIFKAGLLKRAYAAHPHGAPAPTDEARLLENTGFPVAVFPSNSRNRKITHREDLTLLHTKNLRIGHGHDVHRFQKNRPLYLGGILVPEGPGLLGHSDADVAVHALMDAMLGAAGLGDIGHWFPDSDSALRNIRSTSLLEKIWTDLKARGFRFLNADLTIRAQVPKLAPYLEEMRACLAAILETETANINIKATTTEGLGFVGRKEGMAADAVVLLEVGAEP